MSFSLDMTMMFAMHNALRRELERIARVTARTDDDPRKLLRTAAGWDLFKTYLRVHHTSEDIALWPVMRELLADRPDGLALLDAMEDEHAAIDPLLESIDAALVDLDYGHERLGGLADALTTNLTGHLRHEESEGLALIDATLTEEQWKHFSKVHGSRMGVENAPRYFPWLLDSADDSSVAAILNRMPPPFRAKFEDEWRPAFAELTLYP